MYMSCKVFYEKRKEVAVRAFVLEGRGKVKWMEKEKPSLLAEHGVLIMPLLLAPCTSDVHTIWQGSPKRENLTLGHECVGKIIEKGSAVKDFSLGEIVAISAITPNWDSEEVTENESHAGYPFSAHSLGKSIDGAFQECFYLPHADKNCGKIPEGLSLEDALLCTDVLQTGFTAAEEGRVEPGNTVCVLGIGAIGLAAIFAAQYFGASRIFAVGSREESKRLALSMGTKDCPVEVLDYRELKTPLPEGKHPLANSTNSSIVNEIWNRTDGKGVDRVLLCGGDEYALCEASDMVKYGGGVVSNVAYFGADEDIVTEELSGRPLRYLIGGEEREKKAVDALYLPKFSLGKGMAGKSFVFSLSKGGRAHLEKIMKIVREKDFHPSAFFTKSYRGMENIEAALYDMKNRRAVKALVYTDLEG